MCYAIFFFIFFPNFTSIHHFVQIYVVDSLDRERIGKAKQEFQVVKSDSIPYYSIRLSDWLWLYPLITCRLSLVTHLCSTVSSWFLPTNRTWYAFVTSSICVMWTFVTEDQPRVKACIWSIIWYYFSNILEKWRLLCYISAYRM